MTRTRSLTASVLCMLAIAGRGQTRTRGTKNAAQNFAQTYDTSGTTHNLRVSSTLTVRLEPACPGRAIHVDPAVDAHTQTRH